MRERYTVDNCDHHGNLLAAGRLQHLAFTGFADVDRLRPQHVGERSTAFDRVCHSERMLPKPIRAASYGRQSKRREDDSTGSPTAQREKTIAFIAARGWTHVGPHYEDLGASGYDPKADRPGLDALLAAVRRGEVDRLVVYRLDRLTRRGVVEAVRLVGALAEHGASLASVEESHLDTSTPMGRGIFSIFAAMAEQESANISQRTRATKEVLQRAGSWSGGPRPYGFEAVKTSRDGLTVLTLRRHPTEGPVVTDIAARVLAGASIAGEARRLNLAATRTSTGAEWSTSTVARLLRSPVIAGYLVERRPNDPDPDTGAPAPGYTQVVIRDATGQPLQPWDALVDPADWHRLQAVIAARHGGRGPRPTEATLLGGDLFRCASCGGRMSGDRRTNGSGTYRCALHRRGSATCAGAAVAMSLTDDHVVRAVFDRLRDLDPERDPADAILMSAVVSRYTSHHVDPATLASQRAALAVLADAETGLDRLDDDRAAGVFTGPTGTERYRRQSAAMTDRADAARATLAALPRASDAEDVAERWRDIVTELDAGSFAYTDPDSPWQAWTLTERRDFLALFLFRITVGKATSHAGGDKTPWRGHERLTLHWLPF